MKNRLTKSETQMWRGNTCFSKSFYFNFCCETQLGLLEGHFQLPVVWNHFSFGLAQVLCLVGKLEVSIK